MIMGQLEFGLFQNIGAPELLILAGILLLLLGGPKLSGLMRDLWRSVK